MWFFKKRKKALTESDAFCEASPPEKLPVSPFRNTPEYKRIESLFNQADELYTQAKNILGERKPQDLDEESKKKYFDLLIGAYNKLLSRIDDIEFHRSFPTIFHIERLFLSLHRDLVLCYSEGIGVAADDYEKRRHLEVESFLLSHAVGDPDFEPSEALRFWKRW